MIGALIIVAVLAPAIIVSLILYRPFAKVKIPRRRYVLRYGESGWKRRWM